MIRCRVETGSSAASLSSSSPHSGRAGLKRSRTRSVFSRAFSAVPLLALQIPADGARPRLADCAQDSLPGRPVLADSSQAAAPLPPGSHGSPSVDEDRRNAARSTELLSQAVEELVHHHRGHAAHQALRYAGDQSADLPVADHDDLRFVLAD